MANLLTLVLATAVLVIIPGPNVALIVANSIRYGFRMGAITVLGTTVGVAMQLVMVVLSVAAVVEVAVDALVWIRWAGVVYLVYLGIRTWSKPAQDLNAVSAAPAMFWRGCMIAAINPKTLLFNAAFLPQFIATEGSAGMQLAVVATVFLAVLLVGDMLWALTAESAANCWADIPVHEIGQLADFLSQLASAWPCRGAVYKVRNVIVVLSI